MKYIITESRINKIVFDYLDSQPWYTWDIGDGEFNVADGEFGKDQFRFRIQYSSTMPDHSFNVLYINDGLVTQIRKLFSFLSDKDSIKIIIEWFNKEYNKSLTIDDFEWMDTDEEYDD
jgi:hypothetical protein